MVWILLCIQLVNWAIEQKREKQMEKAMSDIGVRFQSFEVQGDDSKSSVKWSSLDGRFWPILVPRAPVSFGHVVGETEGSGRSHYRMSEIF